MAPLPQPGRRRPSRNITYFLLYGALLILLHLCRAEGACNYLEVIKCEQESVKTLEAKKCNWMEIIPPLENCTEPFLQGCNDQFKQSFQTYIMQLNASLQRFAQNGQCKVFSCSGTEVERVRNCTTNLNPTFSTLVTEIKNKGSKGENISAQCSQAQSVISCVSSQAACPAAVAEGTALLGDYSAVNQYCSSTNRPKQDGSVNITVIIIITVLVVFIVAVNSVIVVIYCNRRRNRVRRMPPVIEPFRPSPEYYQYQHRR